MKLHYAHNITVIDTLSLFFLLHSLQREQRKLSWEIGEISQQAPNTRGVQTFFTSSISSVYYVIMINWLIQLIIAQFSSI